MNLTVALKNWLVENKLAKAGASSDEFKKAAGEALATGKLTADKFAELSKPEGQEKANEFSEQMKALATGISTLVTALTGKTEKEFGKAEKDAGVSDDADDKKSGEKKAEKKKESDKDSGKDGWYEKILGRLNADDDSSVEVIPAWKQYRTDNKSAATYPSETRNGRPHQLAGRPIVNFNEYGHAIDNPHDLDKAVVGAFAKLQIATYRRGGSRTAGFNSLNQHDRELLYYAMEHMAWGGCGIDSQDKNRADICGRKLTPREQKALIDDATSGGLEAAPIVFDDMVIQAPLLHSELYPLVTKIPLDRGRRVEGLSTGKVTGSWGGVDDSDIALFNTASYVAAFDTTIFRWEGAIEVGLDFLSDTPIDFGAHISAQYGERLLEDLDDVIATGNGTTQPEGIQTKAGTIAITWSSATSIGNYESMLFGVTKQEHTAAKSGSAVFCGNLTSYQRARAIPVGSSDARRLGGMDYSSWTWMEHPYKINASLANTDVFFAVLSGYRMYVRRGFQIRTSTEGSTLIRANEMMIAVTARYGGQLERGAQAAVTNDAPA